MKKQKVQERLDDKDNKKKEGFGNNLEQAWYKRSPVKIVDDGLNFYFLLFILFYFVWFFFILLFLEQLGLGFISHAVTPVTN